MKHPFKIFILCISLICCSQKNVEKQNLIIGTDNSKIEYEKDQINFYYEKYLVQIVSKSAEEKEITIINKSLNDTLYIFKNSSYYFKGIFNKYLFIDEGTGKIRTLRVYNLNIKEIILETKYKGYIELKRRKVFYSYPFINEKPPILPDCPESKKWESHGGHSGYVEKRIFALNRKKLSKTKQISCEYFE